MRKLIYALTPLALTLAPFSAAVAAETPATQPAPEPAADPYDDLYSSIEEGIDPKQTLERVIDTILTALQREVPEIAIVEDAKPGFLAGLRTGMWPVMEDYSNRVRSAYRPKMVAVLSETLTSDEAREVAAFYRSDLGKKLMAGAAQNFDLDETMRSAVKNPDAPIETAAIAADFKRIGVQAYLGLTPDERKQLDAIAVKTPALGKLTAAQPKITALRAAMENEPPTPDEEARLEEVLKSAFAALDEPDGIN